MTNPFTAANFRAFDSNGAPLSGGLLYSYEAGTTTPLPTYTDNTGATPNANPVVLDATGTANVWMQPGVLYKFVLTDALGNQQWSVDNFPSAAEAVASTDIASQEPGGRLSLVSGAPVTSSDHTAQGTIYYVPYKSDRVPLFDGTNWALFSIGSGLSQTTTDTTKSPAAVATNSNYDLFVWNDSGTIRLSRGPAWSSDTSRGAGVGTTALTQVNGRYVNANSITNGPAATLGLYVGTVRSDGSSLLNDSLALRTVWNNNNRVRRPMLVQDATASWSYNTAAWRQAHASTANQLAMVIGLQEDGVNARVIHSAFTNTGTVTCSAGIGLDSTSALAAACVNSPQFVPGASESETLAASWEGFVGLGFHYLAWLEYGGAPTSSGTLFFAGTQTPGQSGIMGEVVA